MRTVEEIHAEIDAETQRRSAAWDASGEKITALYQELARIRSDAVLAELNLEPGWTDRVAECAKLALGGLDDENDSSEDSVDIGSVRFTIGAERLEDDEGEDE
jgi:hypothetical protein